MSLIEKLQNRSYSKGILFIAIGSLIKSNEIIEFYQEYVGYIRNHGNSYFAKIRPEEAAIKNIAYTLQYYDPVTRSRWLEALPELPKIFNEINTPTVQEIIDNLMKKQEKKS